MVQSCCTVPMSLLLFGKQCTRLDTSDSGESLLRENKQLLLDSETASLIGNTFSNYLTVPSRPSCSAAAWNGENPHMNKELKCS